MNYMYHEEAEQLVAKGQEALTHDEAPEVRRQHLARPLHTGIDF